MSSPQPYTMRDVERMLGLSRSVVRGMISIGLVRPARGSRREYRFSFQDLIVLRAARTLMLARIPQRRIRRSLQELRGRLPETAPLSGLCISAVDDRVVVREGKRHWHADSGQYLLGFDVTVDHGQVRVVEHKQKRGPRPGIDENWFERGVRLEHANPRGAIQAYKRAVESEPACLEAWINWGRLLHDRGTLGQAEAVYRKGLENCGPDAVLLFNLGVLLEDRGEPESAVQAYQAALAENPDFADCHYNLARLYEAQGKPQHAIRHLGRYRRLVTEAT